MANYIHHWSWYCRLGMLFACTYITHLIRGMGLVDVVREIEKVSSPMSLGLATLGTMGMIRWRGTRGYAFITNSKEESEEGKMHLKIPLLL